MCTCLRREEWTLPQDVCPADHDCASDKGPKQRKCACEGRRKLEGDCLRPTASQLA